MMPDPDPLHVPETVRVPNLGDTPTYFLPRRPRLGLALVLLSAGVVAVLVWWWLG